MQPHYSKIPKLSSKIINNNYKSSQFNSYRKERLNMNVMLIINYSSTVMQGKWNLCECHTRFFFLLWKYDDQKTPNTYTEKHKHSCTKISFQVLQDKTPFRNFQPNTKLPLYSSVLEENREMFLIENKKQTKKINFFEERFINFSKRCDTKIGIATYM